MFSHFATLLILDPFYCVHYNRGYFPFSPPNRVGQLDEYINDWLSTTLSCFLGAILSLNLANLMVCPQKKFILPKSEVVTVCTVEKLTNTVLVSFTSSSLNEASFMMSLWKIAKLPL